jgi:hypothetical protein
MGLFKNQLPQTVVSPDVSIVARIGAAEHKCASTCKA